MDPESLGVGSLKFYSSFQKLVRGSRAPRPGQMKAGLVARRNPGADGADAGVEIRRVVTGQPGA